jgi:succinoglycan biosynthesis protein ExoO
VSIKVSTIIPCYNARETIGEAVYSALNQTHRAVEVIIVDDASTDNTPTILRRLSLSDQRVRVIHLPQNAGPGGARNVGIQEASGEWLALLDADDIYEPDRIRTLLDIGLSHKADLVADNFLIEKSSSPTSRTVAFSFDQNSDPVTLTLHDLLVSTIRISAELDFGYLKPVIRRAFVADHRIGFSTKYRIGEDFLFFVECLLQGARLLVVPKPGYIYRRRKNSLTLSGRENNTVLAEINQDLMTRLRGKVNSAEWNALVARQLLFNRVSELNRAWFAAASGLFGQAARELISRPHLIPLAVKLLWIRERRRLSGATKGRFDS